MTQSVGGGRVVVYGGTTGSFILDDTWEWDGNDWNKRYSPANPPQRRDHAMALDSSRSRVVMFGGRKGWPNDLNDTWEWDGATWRRIE